MVEGSVTNPPPIEVPFLSCHMEVREKTYKISNSFDAKLKSMRRVGTTTPITHVVAACPMGLFV